MAVTVDPRAMTADLARQRGPLEVDKIDRRKAYRAVIQLGARRRWRSFSSGVWKRDDSMDSADGKVKGWRHVPAVVETGPISGETLAGLAEAHNSWLTRNASGRSLTEGPDRNYEGDIAKQLLVVSFDETDEIPEDRRMTPGSPQYLRSMVEEIVRGILAVAGPQKTAARKPNQ